MTFLLSLLKFILTADPTLEFRVCHADVSVQVTLPPAVSTTRWVRNAITQNNFPGTPLVHKNNPNQLRNQHKWGKQFLNLLYSNCCSTTMMHLKENKKYGLEGFLGSSMK